MSLMIESCVADYGLHVESETMPVLVDFYGTRCTPCKTLEPILEEAAEELEGKVRFVKVNVNENMELAREFQIYGMPTLFFYKGSELKYRTTGGISRQELMDLIQEHLL